MLLNLDDVIFIALVSCGKKNERFYSNQ